jgi:hypothetical protein
MNRIISVLAVFGVLMGSFAWCGITTEGPPTPEIEIVRAAFGLFNEPESGKPAFVPCATVPHKNNQEYGWIIVIKTKKETVKWREEFTLPSPPETWEAGQKKGSQSISSDKKTYVTEHQVKPVQGIISSGWRVVPGDPKGRHVLRVIIEGKAERTFEFDVK